MSAWQLSLVALASTSAGGLFAWRLREHLHWVLGLTAGMLLGVVAFELLPEAFALSRTLGSDGQPAMIALAAGFLVFHALEKFILVHRAHEGHYADHDHPDVGVLSSATLIGHSFLDGAGIGIAFQVSPAIGITVATAVVAHDFCDGLNTVSLMLGHRNSVKRALRMLALDAIAPVLGVVSTLFFSVPPEALLVFLGFFAGFLLYIASADILPQAHSRAGPARALHLIGLTVLGVVVIGLVKAALPEG